MERSAAIKATRREAVTQLTQGDLPAKVALQRGGEQAKQQRHRGMQMGAKKRARRKVTLLPRRRGCSCGRQWH